MLDEFRQSLADLLDRRTPPDARRSGLARMRDTLVAARLGRDDLRRAVSATRARVQAEEAEVATMQRRRTHAARIGDAETVALADSYAARHTERADVLRRKLAAEEEELVLVEHEVEQMSAAFSAAMAGVRSGRGAVDSAGADEEGDVGGADVGAELAALGRVAARRSREAEADRRLAELKRRMGR